MSDLLIILTAGYYAHLVRDAFGLGEEVSASGYLRTKAIKRKLDAEKKL